MRLVAVEHALVVLQRGSSSSRGRGRVRRRRQTERRRRHITHLSGRHALGCDPVAEGQQQDLLAFQEVLHDDLVEALVLQQEARGLHGEAMDCERSSFINTEGI
jgi:hypothetical protein